MIGKIRLRISDFILAYFNIFVNRGKKGNLNKLEQDLTF